MELDNTAYITPEEAKALQLKSTETHIHSNMGFLNSHNGFRPGCLHVFLGAAHMGKSTLIRTLLRDFAFNKQNSEKRKTMLVWLSEESVQEFKTELSFSVPAHERLMDIKIFSEKDITGSRQVLEEILASHQPDVFMFDNITTSAMYADASVKEQGDWCTWMSSITTRMRMASILVAHTGAEITENINRIINMNDIRGNKKLVNVAQFFYVLQTFRSEDKIFPCLTITKHRGQQLIHGMYLLEYFKEIRAYKRDVAIDFKQFKDFYAKRNKL